MQSVTVSFYDDAENQKFLLTVYSDGVCILNSAYVSVKYPGGGAAQLAPAQLFRQRLWGNGAVQPLQQQV